MSNLTLSLIEIASTEFRNKCKNETIVSLNTTIYNVAESTVSTLTNDHIITLLEENPQWVEKHSSRNYSDVYHVVKDVTKEFIADYLNRNWYKLVLKNA